MNDEDCYHIDELDNENTKDQQNENHIFTSFAATSTKDAHCTRYCAGYFVHTSNFRIVQKKNTYT